MNEDGPKKPLGGGGMGQKQPIIIHAVAQPKQTFKAKDVEHKEIEAIKKRGKPGRKVVSAEEKRTHKITIYLNDEEYADICTHKQNEYGDLVNLSTYIRTTFFNMVSVVGELGIGGSSLEIIKKLKNKE
jgi:hypothetical protein